MNVETWVLALLASALRLSAPLAIAALGELVAERSGVLNIGIEGMMLAGAFAAFSIGATTGSVALALIGSGLAGTALAALFATFVIARRADPIVTGAALNILALGATGSAYRLIFPPHAELPTAPSVADAALANPFLWIVALLLVGVGVFFGRTRAGLAVRASGERAEAAYAQGIRVVGIRWACTLFGGACAGVAGAALVLWISNTFVEGMTAGRGFIALALVLFGGYRPVAVLAGALLFGAANAGQFQLQAAGLEIPYSLLLMTPYLLTLAVLALFAGRTRSPADLARPFTARS